MNPVIRVILGIVIAVVGYWILRKNRTMISWFGVIPWAERKLGSGGSLLFYKLLGVGVVLLGIFVSTNIISSILEGFAGIFIRG